MEEFEIRALATAPNPPRLWCRYVDDTGTVQKKHHVEGLFQHINGQHESIAFTIEEQDSDGNLPMLDVMWSRKGNQIGTDVYRKPTHMDHYLQWDSHHPVAHKLSVVRTLFHRVETHITDEERKKVEKEKIRSDLRRCGYPNWALQEGRFKQTAKTPVQRVVQEGVSDARRKHIVLPYVQGMTERLQRVFRKHNIALHSKPGYTLRQALVAPKDKLLTDEKQGVVYSVKCEVCDKEYIGETERPLSTRMKEHKTSVLKGNDKSALGTHYLETHHTFDWDHIEVVDTETKKIQRRVVEAIHIRLRDAQLNRDRGYDLPPIYLPLLRRGGGHTTQLRTCTSG
jgi:hypothetical protein